MATRSVVAIRKSDTEWAGVYIHNNGCPSIKGPQLETWLRSFKEDSTEIRKQLEKFIAEPGGWSDIGRPYKNAIMDKPNQATAGANFTCEWAYVFDFRPNQDDEEPARIEILQACVEVNGVLKPMIGIGGICQSGVQWECIDSGDIRWCEFDWDAYDSGIQCSMMNETSE